MIKIQYAITIVRKAAKTGSPIIKTPVKKDI